MARLIQTDGEQVGVEYALKERTSLGRGASNEIVLEEKKASRYQAVIILRRGEYMLADLDSKNGTYVNGRQYRIKHLASGDVIRVGKTLFEFYATEDDAPSGEGHLSVSVMDEGEIGVAKLGRYEVGRMVGDEEGLQAESSASAEIKVGPALRCAREMAGASDEDGLCRGIAAGVSALLEHVDRCVILFGDGEMANFFPRWTLNHTDDTSDMVIPLSAIEPVFRERVALVCEDTEKEMGYTAESGADLLKAVSFVTAPIMTKEGVCGAIYADTITRGFYFTREDLHLLALVGVLGGGLLSQLRKSEG